MLSLILASFNAEEFVNDTEGFGDIVGATIDSIHHMHIEIEEKEHVRCVYLFIRNALKKQKYIVFGPSFRPSVRHFVFEC